MKIKEFTAADCELIPSDGFIFVSSHSGAGKSHLITYLFSMPKMRNRFGACVVLSPTSALGDYTQFDFCDKQFHYNTQTHSIDDVLDKVFDAQQTLRDDDKEPGYVACILDDVFTSVGSGAWWKGTLHEKICLRRHSKIFFVCISQSLTNLSPCLRAQCSWFISFVPRTISDRRKIINWFLTKEYLNHSKKDTFKQANEILDTVFSEPYRALMAHCTSLSTKTLDNIYYIKAPEKIAPFKLQLKNISSTCNNNQQTTPSILTEDDFY